MEENIGRRFMRLTAHRFLSPNGQELGLPQPPLESPIKPDLERISLPDPENCPLKHDRVGVFLQERRSVRTYAQEGITLQELSFLLWAIQGVQQVKDNSRTLRCVPSAGARHALDTFLLVRSVEGLPAGLYRYAALAHQLVLVSSSPQLSEQIITTCRSSSGFCRESALCFIWAADAGRMTWRYSERGYRFLHLDAGHVCQNLYLAGHALGCGVCAIGGYDDFELNKLLGLDGEDHFVIYLAAVGRLPADNSQA